MVLSVLVAGVLAQASGGCVKDTDCKGDRICEAGVCVSPGPPPAPPPESFPRVVHLEGQVCVQSLDAQGQVQQSCRAEDAPARRPLPSAADAAWEAPPPAPPPEKARSRFSADVAAHGGAMVLVAGSASFALPQVTAYVAFGSRRPSGAGFVAVTNATLGFNSFGAIFTLNVAPGLRLGAASHVVLSLGPSLLTGGFGGETFTGLAGAAIVQGVISLAGGLVLTTQAGLHFDLSGAMFTAGIGLGFSTL
ncbi:MAG: hypothetical protein Q8L48_08120 [Archangium sp.]|nr:hypothetical protein [Archangium sp.]